MPHHTGMILSTWCVELKYRSSSRLLLVVLVEYLTFVLNFLVVEFLRTKKNLSNTGDFRLAKWKSRLIKYIERSIYESILSFYVLKRFWWCEWASYGFLWIPMNSFGFLFLLNVQNHFLALLNSHVCSSVNEFKSSKIFRTLYIQKCFISSTYTYYKFNSSYSILTEIVFDTSA